MSLLTLNDLCLFLNSLTWFQSLHCPPNRFCWRPGIKHTAYHYQFRPYVPCHATAGRLKTNTCRWHWWGLTVFCHKLVFNVKSKRFAGRCLQLRTPFINGFKKQLFHQASISRSHRQRQTLSYSVKIVNRCKFLETMRLYGEEKQNPSIISYDRKKDVFIPECVTQPNRCSYTCGAGRAGKTQKWFSFFITLRVFAKRPK